MARVRVAISEEDDSLAARQSNDIGAAKAPKSKITVPPKYTIVKLAALAVIVLIVLFFLVVLRDRNNLQKKVDQLSKQTVSEQSIGNEIADLQTEIGKFLELPTGETPTLATVSDIDKVKGQAFFKNAQNGDKVLLYASSGKAILYRPSTKKIIEVAQINTPTSSDSKTTQP